ncbi:MAG: L,D-transpeptidase family protein [Anaerolineae bacterium]|nr:L,D-transpeptidase family protein [Anaerolineae bacterium]
MFAPTQRIPKKTAKKSSVLPYYLLGGLVIAGLMTLACVGILGVAYYFSSSAIPSGVTVASVPVGEKSPDEAAAYLQQHLQNHLLLTDGERNWTVALADLGITIDYESSAQAAMDASSGAALAPSYIIDLNQTQNGLVVLSEQVNLAAVPGDPPQMGRSMEIPVMLDRIRADAGGELADGILELSMIQVEPPPLESVNHSDSARTTHLVEAGQELSLIAKMYGVSLEDILAVNDIPNPDIINEGQELVIPAAGVYEPDVSQAPAAPTSEGKAIVVSTSEQRIYAYENGVLIHSHVTSTGRAETPTVLGDYRIYVKYEATDMSGPGYYLPQVPYTMYFYQGYGIHGTYWHNSFGRPMSHGCVNLPVEEAQWFFEWAEVGTLVRVI